MITTRAPDGANKNKNYETSQISPPRELIITLLPAFRSLMVFPGYLRKYFQFDKHEFWLILDRFHKKSMGNHWNWSVSLIFLCDFTLFVIDIHHIMLIPLFRHHLTTFTRWDSDITLFSTLSGETEETTFTTTSGTFLTLPSTAYDGNFLVKPPTSSPSS